MRIEVKDLDHIYSQGLPYETTALSGISFAVEAGEFVAIIGHTGSGKSTLVQHLNGLLKPTSGTVTADGVDINEKGQRSLELRHRIGMVFQYPEYQLFEETVLKDVCFGPKNQGLDEAQCIERAKDALRLVDIDPEEKGESSPFSLSGGEKRRVAIAGVLAMEPEVLILDEPTAGLDPKGHRDILSMIARIRRERRLTVIWISHNMDNVAELADRVLVMDRGKLIMDASPAEVFSRGTELAKIGLALPSAASLMEKLARRGFPVNTGVFTLNDAEKEIMRVFGRR